MATDELVALDPVTLDLAALEAAASAVPDPELPVVTLGDLGIVRGVSLTADGAIEVRITPTFVGCPATEAIAADVRVAVAARLRESGAPQTEVRTRTAMSPAWSTDWISEDGRRKLSEHGIAPPSGGARHRGGPVAVTIGRGGAGNGGAGAGAGAVVADSTQSAGGVVSAASGSSSPSPSPPPTHPPRRSATRSANLSPLRQCRHARAQRVRQYAVPVPACVSGVRGAVRGHQVPVIVSVIVIESFVRVL